jgi:hypothetical protein
MPSTAQCPSRRDTGKADTGCWVMGVVQGQDADRCCERVQSKSQQIMASHYAG